MKLYILFYEVFFVFCIKKNYQGIIDKYNNKDKRILFFDYQHNETIVLSTTCTDISILNCHIKFYNSKNIQFSLNGVLPSLFEFSSIALNHNNSFEIVIIGGYGYEFSPNMNLYRITFNNNTKLNLTKIKINYGYTESAISIINPIQSLVVYGGHDDINITNKILLFDINSNHFSLIRQNHDYFSLTKRKGHSLTFLDNPLPFLPEIKNEYLYPLIVLFGKNEYDYTRQIDVIIIKKESNDSYYLNNTYSINEIIRGYVYPEPREGHRALYSKDTNSIFLFGGCNYKENRCFNHMIYRLRLFDLYWEKYPFNYSTVKSTEILLVNSNTFLFENDKGQLERLTIKKDEEKKMDNRPRKYSWKTIKKNINDNTLLNDLIKRNETEIDQIIQKILADIESNYIGERYKELKDILSQIKDMKKDKFNILNQQLSDIKNKFKAYKEKTMKENKKNETKCNNTILIKPNSKLPITNNTHHTTNSTNITKQSHLNNHTEKIYQLNNTINNKSKQIKNLTVNHKINVSHNYTNHSIQENLICNTCNKAKEEKNKTITPYCNRCNKTKVINQSSVNSTNSTLQLKTTLEHNNNTIPQSNLTQKHNITTHNETHSLNNITQIKLKPNITSNSTKVNSTSVPVKKIAHATLHIPLGKHSKKRFNGYSFLQKDTIIPPPKSDSNLTPLLLGLSGIVFLTLLYCFTFRTENNSLIK